MLKKLSTTCALGALLLTQILYANDSEDIAKKLANPTVSLPNYLEDIPEPNNAWSYELEPYMLIASMSGTSKVVRGPTLEIDVNFGTILENLDIGAMIHFEAHNQNGWGLWLDYGFMDLSSDITAPVDGVINARVRQGTLEAFAMYRQPVSNGTLDYLVGIRWWDNDFDIGHSALPIDIEVEEDWVDLVAGARWTTDISKSWKFSVNGTVAGLGSDLSLSGAVGVKYVINDLLDFDLQYKAIWVDYESGTKGQAGYFAYDVTAYGPTVGLNFKF